MKSEKNEYILDYAPNKKWYWTNYIRLRKEAKLSQEQLAKETNIIRTTIARIENNMNSPQIHCNTVSYMMQYF